MVSGEGHRDREKIMLRYGVLWLLIEQRGYGYQLVQRLSERLGPAWRLNPSTVYGALDQLEAAKLIEAAPVMGAEAHADQPISERPSRRAARIVYEATERGVGEFQAWLARPSLRATPIRSEIQLKVALAGPDNIPPLLASIAQEEWTIMRRLDEECQAAGVTRRGTPHLAIAPDEQSHESRATSARAEGGESTPSGGWPSTATALVNAAATTRLQAELAWIEVVRETLQRMTAQQISTAGRVGLAGAATAP
jgi:DNA-binding PadR family transcriptional regulator